MRNLKNKRIFFNIKHIHMVGIGGQGMSGIAEVLLEYGYSVSGSDIKPGEKTEYLEKKGIFITYEHKAENVEGASVVVISSAIKNDNIEVIAAQELGIPVIRRAEMLAEIIRLYRYGICVSGTHGKTTTTTMISLILNDAGIDPTVVVGGILKETGANSVVGGGEFIVVEADEYDHSFLKFLPSVAVITNIDEDHLDCYKDLNEIKNAFIEFANKVPFYGSVVLCIDDENVISILKNLKRNYLSYGFNRQADIRATDVVYKKFGSEFTVIINNEKVGRIKLNVPGPHNIRNALAAVGVGKLLNIDFKIMANALSKFSGVKRRFEICGESNGIVVVDDYAHHPREVEATLQAARTSCEGDLIAIFQPHLYSRTRDFYKEFAKAFLQADKIIVTDIYGARENPIDGVTSDLLVKTAKDYGHKFAKYIPDKNEVPEFIKSIAKKGDVVVIMGAGNINQISESILKIL